MDQTNLSVVLRREKITSKRCPVTESRSALIGIDRIAVFRCLSSSIGSSISDISANKLSMDAAMTDHVVDSDSQSLGSHKGHVT